MTPEQYERWKDFSRRMVNVARSTRHRAPSRADTLEIIDALFDTIDYDDGWKRVESWDHTAKKDGDDSWGYPLCVSDIIKEMEDGHVPYYWSVSERRRERLVDQWMGPASCCIRAGLDLAVAPSGGVVGFTAGDIRKMYPEGVPQWVKDVFDEEPGELVALHATNISGIYHPETEPDARKFDDFPDDLGLWL